MQRQPLNVHYLRRHLTKPKETTPRKFSLFSRSKTTRTVSNQADGRTTPDCVVITTQIPTPDDFYDETGYTFSAVTLGSNPLYNWSVGSTATSKDKNTSVSEDEQEEGKCNKQQEEGESVLDFRITSMDGSGKARPGNLWLPSLKSVKPEQSLPKTGSRALEEDESPPSSGCEGNSKAQLVHTGTGMITGE